MKTKSIFVVVAALGIALWIGTTASSQPPRPQPTNAILGLLKKGQAISMKDCGYNYALSIFENGVEPLGYTVIEVTDSYVVVRDLPGITDLAIPIWSIKSVATVHLPEGAK